MFGLFRILSPIVAALCSLNVLLSARRLIFIEKIAKRSRLLAWLAALLPALTNMYFMLDTFSTVWMALLNVSAVLLVCNFISLILRAFGRDNRARRAWIWLKRRGLAFALAAALTAFGLMHIKIVRQTDYNITTDKPIGEIKIALIADSHLGMDMNAIEFEDVLSRAINAGADMLILAGDLTDERTDMAEFKKMCASLKKIRAPLGAYFVFGNHDGGHYGGDISEYAIEQMFSDAGVTVLTDESILLNGVIRVIGRKDASNRARLSTDTLLAQCDIENEFVIVIDHQPAETRANADAGTDLLLSGHTHNGQIWPLNLIAEWFKINEIEYGFEKIGDMNAIVTSGVSGWGFAFRTAGVSEYCIITVNGEN